MMSLRGVSAFLRCLDIGQRAAQRLGRVGAIESYVVALEGCDPVESRCRGGVGPGGRRCPLKMLLADRLRRP